jgi:AAA+ ATPase superfamily predicted ATPase
LPEVFQIPQKKTSCIGSLSFIYGLKMFFFLSTKKSILARIEKVKRTGEIIIEPLQGKIERE